MTTRRYLPTVIISIIIFIALSATFQLSSGQSLAQAPSDEFNKTIGGENDEIANSIQTTYEGGYILAGSIKRNLQGDKGSAWLAKTDAQGNELWNKTLTPPMHNSKYIYTVGGEAKSVQSTSDGGYILTGWINDPGISRLLWILKTDYEGNVVWMNLSNNIVSPIQPTSDGNYIVAGKFQDRPYMGKPWISKIDDNGNELWNKTFDTFDTDRLRYHGTSEAQSVQPTSDGGYIIAGINYGYSDLNGVKKNENWLIKTDESGNEIWNKKFEGNGVNYDDQVVSVHTTPDGGYILASMQTFASDDQIIKTDDKGNEIWNRRFRFGCHDLKTTPDGGCILAGQSEWVYGTVAGIVKIDAQGNELWNKTFPTKYTSEFRSVLTTPDGGYILAGITNSFGAGGYDAWIVKIDANGLVNSVSFEPKVSNIQEVTESSQNSTTDGATSKPPQKSPDFAEIPAIAALLCIYVLSRKD